jgi:hypothetical protein
MKHVATVMLNLPGEGVRDVFETLHYARSLNCDFARSSVYSITEKQPITDWLLRNHYIDRVPAVDNFNPTKIEDVAIKSPDMKRIIRLSAFFNVMFRFPFLIPLFRLLSFFPVRAFGWDRIYDGYLEMRFMAVPALQGLRYFLRVRKGLNAFQSLK